MGCSGVRPLKDAPSTFMFVKGVMGGRRVYPPLMKNWDCGTAAIGIN
jgi:hypothetical protein